MAEIISIGTAVPEYCHRQKDIFEFMSSAYRLDETEKRKLKFLYGQSAIDTRYSVVADYSLPKEQWVFLPQSANEDFPSLEKRMEFFNKEALPLCLKSIAHCIEGFIESNEVTHLITVSCTGMSAPGIDLEICECLQLRADIFRTSVNFMGCYAAIHALKLAKYICDTTPSSNVLIVDVELCTLHFQKDYTADNAGSSLLFGDGAATVLVSNYIKTNKSISIDGFYGEVAFKGKKDMAWQLSSKGFLMTLSGYVPKLIEEDIDMLVQHALKQYGLNKEEITHWCIHPGGKKILQVVEKQLALQPDDICHSLQILKQYGNMSSPTILFVLKSMMDKIINPARIFGLAFGPGLTMETFSASIR